MLCGQAYQGQQAHHLVNQHSFLVSFSFQWTNQNSASFHACLHFAGIRHHFILPWNATLLLIDNLGSYFFYCLCCLGYFGSHRRFFLVVACSICDVYSPAFKFGFVLQVLIAFFEWLKIIKGCLLSKQSLALLIEVLFIVPWLAWGNLSDSNKLHHPWRYDKPEAIIDALWGTAMECRRNLIVAAWDGFKLGERDLFVILQTMTENTMHCHLERATPLISSNCWILQGCSEGLTDEEILNL